MTRFERITDVGSGDWIAPRLGGDFGAVGRVCPTGFEAYARVFHPVEVGGERPLTWAEVCAITGRTPHALMQWGLVSGVSYGVRLFGDWDDGDPQTGSLGDLGLATLAAAIGGAGIGGAGIGDAATGDAAIGDAGIGGAAIGGAAIGGAAIGGAATGGDAAIGDTIGGGAGAVTVGVWSGYGDGTPPGPTLELPGRGYTLYRGSLSMLRDPGWQAASGRHTLNLAWPDDRSWFVASEIDFDSTVVGGSRGLIDRVFSSGLEAAEVTAASDLSWEGDLVNPR